MIKFLFAAAVGLFLSIGSASASAWDITYQFIQESVTRTGNPPPDDSIFDKFYDLENYQFRASIKIIAHDSLDLDNIHADAHWEYEDSYWEYLPGGGRYFVWDPKWSGAKFYSASLTIGSPQPIRPAGRWGGNISIVDTILDGIQINGQLRDRYYVVMGGDEYLHSTVDFGPSMISWTFLEYGTSTPYEMSYEVKGRWERSVSTVPLPASLPLLLGGIAALAALRHRGRKAAA